mmetsp:Transcript_108221/g.214965  ORF Transcript_108221/g.214965 Transcript_108221/m.214965 type:complete len:510 (-) Transcript_108221:104-1633(-)
MSMERAVASSALDRMCIPSQEASIRRPRLQSAVRCDSVARCSGHSLIVSGHFFASAALAGVAWVCARRVAGRRLHRDMLLVQVQSAPSDMPDLDSVSVALELAERVEDFEEAARLRDRIRSLEEAYPFQALLWRQQRQVMQTIDQVLRSNNVLETRLSAVKRLQELASPPAVAPGAEDALHKALREVSGSDAEAVRRAISEALIACWLQSGDEETDSTLKAGMTLLDLGSFGEATKVFSEVIERVPTFAEAWNKRATAFYFMKDYEASISDCKEVLRLKPRHFGCMSGLGKCYLAQGDAARCLQCMRAALEVHPDLAIAKRHVMQARLQTALEPQVTRAVEAFRKGDEVAMEQGETLLCHWDVHQMVSPGPEAGGGFLYFFRLKYTNHSSQPVPCTARSLARFYVLHFADGEVFPFTRITEEGSPAQFTLSPGDEYKFCWVLIVGRPLKGMTGGTVFEVLDDDVAVGFTHAGLEVSCPRDAEEVTGDKARMLGAGHHFTGHLDLRHMKK